MNRQTTPTAQEHDDPSNLNRKYLLWSRDHAAYFYGRLLMLEDERIEWPSHSTLKEDELDRYDVQVLQIIAEIDNQFSGKPTGAFAVSKYFLKSSNEMVQQVGRHLQGQLKQRATELHS